MARNIKDIDAQNHTNVELEFRMALLARMGINRNQPYCRIICNPHTNEISCLVKSKKQEEILTLKFQHYKLGRGAQHTLAIL